jgi:hypothetical protein
MYIYSVNTEYIFSVYYNDKINNIVLFTSTLPLQPVSMKKSSGDFQISIGKCTLHAAICGVRFVFWRIVHDKLQPEVVIETWASGRMHVGHLFRFVTV